MASPGALFGSLKHYIWNPRKSDFFPSFDAEIELDRNIIRPYKPIRGRLKLTTTRLIRFNGGIRVQLDANVKLRFNKKVDNRTSVHWAIQSILENAPEPEDGNYILSPIRQQLMGDEEFMDEPCTMEEGTYEFPFTLDMGGEHLPAPFHSTYGNLHYFIVAYMGSPYCYVQVAERAVGFGGFLNLAQFPESTSPLECSSVLHKSMFSSKGFITFTLRSEQQAYHPGEVIDFKMTIDNPNKKQVTMVKVMFVRKATYTTPSATKSTSTVLDTFEADGGDDDAKIIIYGSLNVPKPCAPSYNGKEIYNLTYQLQYEVKIKGHPAIGKGHHDILIGTTKPSAALLVNKLQSRRESEVASVLVGDDLPMQRPRSNSVYVTSAQRPLVTHLNESLLRPPSASNSHPSRTLSMLSLSSAGT